MLVSIKRADLLRLAQIVREETGNHVQEKNFPMLESRIKSHVLTLRLTSMEQYWTYFEQNEVTERTAIKSLMTTHYTFFFREYAHFDVLETWIEANIDHLFARYKKDKIPLRVWSAACSRGQEVYSLAMFLEVKVFKKHNLPFEVLGTDIDPKSVKFAENGVYPVAEVNTIPREFLTGHWKWGKGNIKEFAAAVTALKCKVSFSVLNLLDIQSLQAELKFDVIFCRNVFIYFSQENVKKIALNLADRLNSNGLFVSGVSEAIHFDGWKLISVGPSCYAKSATKSVSNIRTTDNTSSDKTAKSELLNETPSTAKQPDPIRVLCVDDSPTIHTLMKKVFSSDPSFAAIDIATDGLSARQKLDQAKYDLITLDIHMPNMNGLEFLEKAFNPQTDPPVIMVSSVNRSDIDLATRALAIGAFDYVEKPSMNNLIRSTEEIITKAKMAIRSKPQERFEVQQAETLSGVKIVVPDASQALRVLIVNQNKTALEHIIKGLNGEYRSPPLLILCKDQTNIRDLLEWTKRQIVEIKSAPQRLRPNTIYVCTHNEFAASLNMSVFRKISLQVLDSASIDLSFFASHENVQLLVEENLVDASKQMQTMYGLRVSDITPAISFLSLSMEYFANFRKSVA